MLEHMTEVFTCVRCCNVALRWLFLHTCSSHKKLRAAVASSAPPMQDVLALLLDTALLEFEVCLLLDSLGGFNIWSEG